MDNAGDWLYIVFLIVAGLSTLLGSKKKKKQTEVLGQPGKDIATESEQQPQKGFWEILQEMQEEQKEEPRPIEKTKSSSAKKNKQIQQKKAAPTPFLTAENEIKTQIAADKAAGMIIPEEENILADIEFSNADDLRKAVIYAEILNRKY